MHHLFKVTMNGKSKLVTVEGTHEYALSYISGYVQALRDKFGNGGKITVEKASDDVVMNHN
jgi:hypothetical protein|tara:strand:+ start:177 stop:359 length:183 start_codon:yes stop_codon:yes gene_type:complete